jgi:hypothetical protein
MADSILAGEDEVRLAFTTLVSLKDHYKRSLEAVFEQNKEVRRARLLASECLNCNFADVAASLSWPWRRWTSWVRGRRRS